VEGIRSGEEMAYSGWSLTKLLAGLHDDIAAEARDGS